MTEYQREQINIILSGPDPFDGEAEARKAAADGTVGGWWCDLETREARAIARLIVSLLDGPE